MTFISHTNISIDVSWRQLVPSVLRWLITPCETWGSLMFSTWMHVIMVWKGLTSLSALSSNKNRFKRQLWGQLALADILCVMLQLMETKHKHVSPCWHPLHLLFSVLMCCLPLPFLERFLNEALWSFFSNFISSKCFLSFPLVYCFHVEVNMASCNWRAVEIIDWSFANRI